MQYIQETLMFQAQMKREEHKLTLEQMEMESLLVLEEAYDAIATFDIVEEAARGRQSILQRVKDFFKRLLDMFVQKLKSFSRSNKQWWINNEERLQKVNFKGLSVEVYPYVPENSAMSVDLGIIQNRIAKEITSANKDLESKRERSDADLQKRFVKNYLNAEGEFVGGMKNYYRSGKRSTTEAKPVTLRDNELRTFVLGRAKTTVMKYDAAEAAVRKFLNAAERNIANLERELDRRTAPTENTVKEHFSILEESLWTVLEDTKPATKSEAEKKKEDDNKPDMAVKRSGMHEGQVTSHDAANMTNRQLSVVSFAARIYQQLFSVMLTILEEQVSAYMKIARGVLSSAGQHEKDKDKVEKEDKKKA